jgi:hypothetical protein
MTTWHKIQVGRRTMQTRLHANIGIPYDKHSDYHIADHPACPKYSTLVLAEKG